MTQCTKAEALKSQVAGDHYVKLKIQTAEFAMANHWDACAFSILKYVTRHQSKNLRQDLEKARHFIDLREALFTGRWCNFEVISIQDYCHANQLPVEESSVLACLACWVWTGATRDRLELIVALENLMSLRYGPVDDGEIF